MMNSGQRRTDTLIGHLQACREHSRLSKLQAWSLYRIPRRPKQRYFLTRGSFSSDLIRRGAFSFHRTMRWYTHRCDLHVIVISGTTEAYTYIALIMVIMVCKFASPSSLPSIGICTPMVAKDVAVREACFSPMSTQSHPLFPEPNQRPSCLAKFASFLRESLRSANFLYAPLHINSPVSEHTVLG